MTREEVIIDGDAFIANSVLSIFPFNHAVYQQERISGDVNIKRSKLVFSGDDVNKV